MGVESRFQSGYTDHPFADMLSHSWWRLLLRGLFAIAFAVLTFFRPGISLTALVLSFGIYALADGVIMTWMAIAERKEQDHWWLLLIGGLLGIGIGVLTFATPGVTALALLFYIAIWAIGKGVLEIVAAIRLRKEIEGEWLLILAGLASVFFGAFLMARPGTGALTLVTFIAAFALFIGVLLVVLAFKVRKLGKRLAQT